MASAVMIPQNALAKLEELQARAKEIEKKFQDFQEEKSRLATEMRQCADLIAGANGSTNGAAKASTGMLPIPVKKRGRPKGSVNQPKEAKKPGRPKGSKNKPATVTGKKLGRPKGSKNKVKIPVAESAPVVATIKGEMKLEDAILHVLAHPKTWRRHIPDLPKGCDGLKVMEITQIVQGEGLWKSDSKHPEGQVSQRLADLRAHAEKSGLPVPVVRGDQMRYRLP